MSTLRIARPGCLDQLAQHALIEASAGTGKTYTIEHLVVDLVIRHAVPIEQILVVTFTRKAAAEMSERIRDRLVRCRDANGSTALAHEPGWEMTPEARRRIEAAIAGFDQAPISTIHSFCQRVLSEQEILTGHLREERAPSADTLFHDAWMSTLRELLEAGGDAGEVLEAALRVGTKAEKLEAILAAVRDQADRVRPLWPGDDDPAPHLMRLRGLLSAPPADLAVAIDAAGSIAAKSRANWIGSLQSLVEVAARFSSVGDPAFVVHLCENAGWAYIKSMAPYRKRQDLAGWVGETLRALGSAIGAVGSAVPLYIRYLLPPTLSRFAELARQRGTMDQDGLLTATRDALCEGPAREALLASLRLRYAVALVDEFQDTDACQWEIFQRIFVDANGPQRFIAVGDPKQAIYRFRGGDIETYFAARKALGGAPVALTGNWRSTSAMVDAYNRIIRHPGIDGTSLLGSGDVRYDHPVTAERPDGGLYRAGVSQPLLPLQLLRFSAGDVPVMKAALRAAIVTEICALLDTPHELEEEQNGERVRRRLAAGDFMCLTTTNEDARLLVAALRESGVAAAQYRAAGLWQSPAAPDMVDLLCALAAPDDRGLRRKAFLSPFLGFALDELAAVDALPPSDARLLAWRRWLKLAGERRWHALFGELRRTGGLARRAALSTDGEAYQAALGDLLDQAHALALESCPDIETLARQVLELYRERKAGEYVAGDGEEDDDMFSADDTPDAVRVLTVFKAKGLEAPVVFVAYGPSGGGGGGRGIKLEPYHHGDGSRLLWAGGDDPVVKATIEREKDLEARRFQYVAITRPKARLVLPLIVPAPPAKPKISPKYRHLNERLLSLGDDPAFVAERELRAVDGIEAPPVRPSLTSASTPAALPSPPVDLGAPRAASIGVRAQAVGLKIDSFSKLHHSLKSQTSKPPSVPVDAAAVPRGATAGVQIHALIERIPLKSVVPDQPFEAWRRREEIDALLKAWWAHSRWTSDQRNSAERMVVDALHVPMALPDGELIPGLGTLAGFHREVPFHFPFPDGTPFGEVPQGPWRIEHGYMTGVIDFAFEYDGRVYFGDWKTNSLADYAPELVRQSVEADYVWQIRIYTLALMRALGIATREQYAQRFGGVLYVYLRGLNGEGRGVCSLGPPPWEQLEALDEMLRAHAGRATSDEPETGDAAQVALEVPVRDVDESDADDQGVA